jgi:hypothetical protein
MRPQAFPFGITLFTILGLYLGHISANIPKLSYTDLILQSATYDILVISITLTLLLARHIFQIIPTRSRWKGLSVLTGHNSRQFRINRTSSGVKE